MHIKIRTREQDATWIVKVVGRRQQHVTRAVVFIRTKLRALTGENN